MGCESGGEAVFEGGGTTRLRLVYFSGLAVAMMMMSQWCYPKHGLHVPLLEEIEKSHLDLFVKIGKLIHGKDAAVGTTHQPRHLCHQ